MAIIKIRRGSTPPTTNAQLGALNIGLETSGKDVYANFSDTTTPNIKKIGGENVVFSDEATTITGAYTFNNPVIVASPTAGGHAANKTYVDSLAQGLNIKPAVKLATTTVIPGTVTYNDLELTSTTAWSAAIDGIAQTAIVQNDRILVKNQVNQAHNGIYYVASANLNMANWILRRAEDSNLAEEINAGTFCFVQNGTANKSTGWVQTNIVDHIDTSNKIYTQFSSAGVITSLDDLTDVNVAGASSYSIIYKAATEWTATAAMTGGSVVGTDSSGKPVGIDGQSGATTAKYLRTGTYTGDTPFFQQINLSELKSTNANRLVLTGSGSTVGELSAGTDGQYLKASSTAPTWQSPSTAVTTGVGTLVTSGAVYTAIHTTHNTDASAHANMTIDGGTW